MDSCSLCDSYQNEKYRIIYDDGTVFVMMNNQPLKDGHVIILPVRHAENLGDLTNEEAGAIMKLTERCMKAAEKLSGVSSLALVNGWAFRSQPHFHAHVIPTVTKFRTLFSSVEGGDGGRDIADTATLERTAKEFAAAFE